MFHFENYIGARAVLSQLVNKKRPVLIAVLGLCAIIGFSGCSKRWLTSHKRDYAPQYQETKEGVSLRVRMVSPKESRERFGANLIYRGYQPLTLTIYNNTDDALLLRASSIDLPLERAKNVARSAHLNTFAITVAPACFSAIFYWPALIPVIGSGLWVASRNRTIMRKTKFSSLEGDAAIEILPHERVCRDIFVKVDAFSHFFSLHLFNVHQKSFIPFNVGLS